MPTPPPTPTSFSLNSVFHLFCLSFCIFNWLFIYFTLSLYIYISKSLSLTCSPPSFLLLLFFFFFFFPLSLCLPHLIFNFPRTCISNTPLFLLYTRILIIFLFFNFDLISLLFFLLKAPAPFAIYPNIERYHFQDQRSYYALHFVFVLKMDQIQTAFK